MSAICREFAKIQNIPTLLQILTFNFRPKHVIILSDIGLNGLQKYFEPIFTCRIKLRHLFRKLANFEK